MRLQLRAAALKPGERAHRHQFALGVGEVVAGEDVAEEVSLQVIVRSRGERVVERPARQLRLHLRALPQGVIILLHRTGLAPLGVALALRLALLHDTLQRAQGVKAAREARVGVKLRQGLLHLVHRQSGVKTTADGRLQPVDVALGLEARYGHDGLLFFVKYVFHILLTFYRAAGSRHYGRRNQSFTYRFHVNKCLSCCKINHKPATSSYQFY